MARRLAVSVMLALLLGMVLSAAVSARSTRQTSEVMWHPQTGMTGSVGSAARATLVRRHQPPGTWAEVLEALRRQLERASNEPHDDRSAT